MGASSLSRWQKLKQFRVAIGVVAIVLVVVIALIIVGYWFDWTGFNGYNKVTITHTISGANAGTVTKTEEYQPGKGLWDWLGLLAALAIPVVVGLGAAWFTAQQGKASARENEDNQREAALQAYIDKISKLLLKGHLGELTTDGKLKPAYEQLRKIARVRTLTVLRNLDPGRKASVLSFLYDSGLIHGDNDNGIINLKGADFSQVNIGIANLSSDTKVSMSWMREHGLYGDLQKARLAGVNLRKAQLSGINLKEADLSETYLSDADLEAANLEGADLHEARFRYTILQDATLTHADLHGAYLHHTILKNAKLVGADLCGADLKEASLEGADLCGANLQGANLEGAILTGAIMPDGKIHA